MFKVSLENLLDGRQWEARFETEELANSWLAQQKLKPGRLDIRIVPISDSYRQEDVLEVIETEIDGQMMQTHVRLAAQASYNVEDISVQVASDLAKYNARKYLAETDWYAIRKADIGTAIPEEISALRQAARDIL